MGPKSSALRRLQWAAVVLCTMAIVVNYIDRATVAIANPAIRSEFGLSAEEIAKQPEIGDLFQFEVDVPGVPCPLVRY